MECTRIRWNLSPLLDGEMAGSLPDDLHHHLTGCPECREEWEELQKTTALLRALPSVEPSPETAAAWRAALIAAGGRKARLSLASLTGPKWLRAAAVGVAAVLVLGTIGQLAGQPFASKGAAARGAPILGPAHIAVPGPPTYGAYKSYQAAAPFATASQSAATAAPIAGRDIVQTVQLNLAVPKVGTAFQKAQAIAATAKGYVSNSAFTRNPLGDTANLTLRVPVRSLNAVLGRLSALGTIRSESRNGQNITSQYVDTQTQLADLQAEDLRYRQFLTDAKSIQDMLNIEAQLSHVSNQINILTARMRSMSDQVALASITLNLSVPLGTPASPPQQGLGQALSTAFLGSLGVLLNLGRLVLLGLAWTAPFLALIGAAYGGYKLTVKMRRER